MPEPLSILSVQLGFAAVYALSRPGSAVSLEAREVQARAEQIFQRVEQSDALFGEKAGVISDLWELANSHAEAGWDGGQALPADPQAIARALSLARALPEGCPLPELGVDPDGAISMDWICGRLRMLSVSVTGDSDRLAYAWIDGTDRGHAVARFGGEAVPLRLLQAIQAMRAV